MFCRLFNLFSLCLVQSISSYLDQVSSYQMKKIVKDFNSECDKIRMSKNTVYNYRKCISDNMETLIKQIISIQKNEVKKIKANQKPNHKRKNRNF